MDARIEMIALADLSGLLLALYPRSELGKDSNGRDARLLGSSTSPCSRA
jgi:hypothetical protein